MREAKFFGVEVISTSCVLILLLAVGMGIFPDKAQAGWENHSAFVTFNDLSNGNPIVGNRIRDDDMDPGEGFISGYRDGTYPYTYNGNQTFEVAAYVRNPPPGQKLVYNSFRVFISNMTALDPTSMKDWEQYVAESHRTVVLDFTSRSAELAPEDNVYIQEVAGWAELNVPFSVNNKLPSLLKMNHGGTLSGTDEYGDTTESDLKLWFAFVVLGLTPGSIDEGRELRLDGHDCGLIVFYLNFDFEISAERVAGLPLNPVDAALANKWTVTNTSSVTLEIEEKVLVNKGKGKAREEWRQVPLARYDMPFQLTMILASGGSLAPGKHNVLSTFWGKIKER